MQVSRTPVTKRSISRRRRKEKTTIDPVLRKVSEIGLRTWWFEFDLWAVDTLCFVWYPQLGPFGGYGWFSICWGLTRRYSAEYILNMSGESAKMKVTGVMVMLMWTYCGSQLCKWLRHTVLRRLVHVDDVSGALFSELFAGNIKSPFKPQQSAGTSLAWCCVALKNGGWVPSVRSVPVGSAPHYRFFPPLPTCFFFRMIN